MTEDVLPDTAEDYARERLSEKRHAHTLRVAETAERLARLHGLDPDRARLAGLLHDSAREIGVEELLRVAERGNLQMGDFETEKPILLHGPVAARLAERDLGVRDEAVLDAVRQHTTGAPGMGPIALALFVADKIEPGRGDDPELERIRDLARTDLRRAARESLRSAISYNEGKGRPTHPKSRETLEWLEGPGDKAPDGGV